jgi:signal recognition particle receptor subunit beta
MIDSNDRCRIEDVKYQFDKCMNEEELKDTIVLIMANKQDIPGCLSIDEIESLLELDKYANRSVNVIGTVATTGRGIDESFEWIASQLFAKHLRVPVVETINDWKYIFTMQNKSILNYFSNFFTKTHVSESKSIS